jgi:hypothetical protein
MAALINLSLPSLEMGLMPIADVSGKRSLAYRSGKADFSQCINALVSCEPDSN